MATIMEKDVLLEYVSFGWLIKDDTPQSREDLHRMGQLWREILDTPYEEIDYWAMVERIKKLRSKYEKQQVEINTVANDDSRSLVY